MSDSDPDVWHSPTAKSRFKVVERAAERLTLEFENELGDIGPPEHLHPHQDEEFTVLDGALLLRVGGKDVHLTAGQSHVVPRGVAHTFHNEGEGRVRFTSQHRPALGFERFLKTIYDLDRDGRANRQGQPRLLQLMVILKSRGGEELLAGPPRFVQRAVAWVLGTLGELFGYASVYESRLRAKAVSAGNR
jgi:mannose-6-phosphate isomerase-like protein (cupin superfamily)